MIKTSDFARENGVTPRAVRKLLQTYEAELEGHYERKGQSGTWIDEHAQEFLRAKMIQTPVVLYNESAAQVRGENDELKIYIKELEGRIIEIKDNLAGAYRALADERSKVNSALLEAQKSMVQLQLLEAAKGEAEDRAAALARENTLLIQKKLDVELQLKATEEDLKTAEDVAEATGQELEKTKVALEQEKTRPITLKEFFQRRKRR